MFYAFNLVPLPAWGDGTIFELEMKLTAGVIHQVDVLFQVDCDHLQFVQIFHANHQLWPSNRGASLRGNATVVSFREFYEIDASDPALTARFWSTNQDVWEEIIVQIGLLPKRIIQPLSFDELLAAAQGIE